ncbi:unnamed protein product [Mesocestoides corti]|uniref:Exosome complex component RRP45 n=1 Tax=Mesocestoides corti TaxID=53468 RepID=A0A0R3UIW7_MESCO|nr:unnamed protein product [Mesocestoides corti]
MLLSDPECATLTQMLLSGVRLDGRTLKEYREINFRFPSGHPCGGCCIVNIGSTSVLAKVSAEIVEPKHYRPAQGVVFVNFDASIVSFLEGKRKGRSRDDEGRRLSSVLQICFRDCIDVDALCIVAWERVFAIRIDLRALSFDGNLGDCGALAAVAALASFRRPDVVVDTEMKRRPPVRLNMRRIPVLVTLGLASDTKIILQDPTQREESIMTGGRVMVGLTGHGELCCVHTSGLTTPIRPESLSRCIVLANARAKSLVALLHRVIDAFERKYVETTAARSSDLDVANRDLSDLNLTASSTYFLPGGKNAPEGLAHVEEGELMSGEDDDFDMEVCSTEKSSEGEVVDNPLSRDPYGVIEVSSLLAHQERPVGSVDDNNGDLGFQSIESDSAALTRSLLPHRGIKRITKGSKKREVLDEEEEEGTDVVQLY